MVSRRQVLLPKLGQQVAPFPRYRIVFQEYKLRRHANRRRVSPQAARWEMLEVSREEFVPVQAGFPRTGPTWALRVPTSSRTVHRSQEAVAHRFRRLGVARPLRFAAALRLSAVVAVLQFEAAVPLRSEALVRLQFVAVVLLLRFAVAAVARQLVAAALPRTAVVARLPTEVAALHRIGAAVPRLTVAVVLHRTEAVAPRRPIEVAALRPTEEALGAYPEAVTADRLAAPAVQVALEAQVALAVGDRGNTK